jgi:hypothetical protein
VEGFNLHRIEMSRTGTEAFKRLLTFKEHTMPEVYKTSVAVLPNHMTLKSAFQRLDATIEEYIDKMPPLPKSPSPRRATSKKSSNENGGNTVLELSHAMEGKLGGKRRTYKKRKQSRRRR